MKIVPNPALESENSTQHHYEISYLEFIDNSNTLNYFLSQIRKRVGLPLEGLSFNRENIEGLNSDKEKFRKYVNAGIAFVEFFKLPPYWVGSGMNIVVFNIGRPPSRKPIEISLEKDGRFPELVIRIRERMTARKLRDYLSRKENKEDFDSQILFLPKPPSVGFTNIDFKKEVVNKRDLGKKYREIVGEIELLYGEDSIGKYTRRARQTLKELHKQYLLKSLGEYLQVDSSLADNSDPL